MDLNNDGLDDLIVGERNGYVNYYRRLSDGSLTSEGRIQASGTDIDVGTNSAPFMFDWDNDGDLDLLAGREITAGGSIWLYINSGTPADHLFTTYTPVQVGTSNISWSRSVPTMADMNGDGLLDLVVGEDNGHNYYLENEGSIGSPDFNSYSAVTVNGSPFSWPSGQTDTTVWIDDWNQDGTPDIIQGNYATNLWVFLGNSTGTADFSEAVPPPGLTLELASNPVSGVLSYSLSSDMSGSAFMALYGTDGRVVASWSHQADGTVNRSVSTLPSGTYMLTATSGGSTVSTRLAIVR